MPRLRGLKQLSQFTIPESVTEIPDSTFYGCSSLATINLQSIQVIQKSAFRSCSSLASITIPASVRSIGESAFMQCTALETIIFEHKTESIEFGSSVFRDCLSLKSIALPKGTQNLTYQLFCYCKNLTEVIIPPDAAILEIEMPFQSTAIRELVIPENVVSYKYAFEGMDSIEKLIVYAKTLDALYSCSATELEVYATEVSGFSAPSTTKTLKFMSDIVTIGDYSFQRMYTLESLTIPSTVKTIGKNTFWNLPIKTITLPSALESVGDTSFTSSQFTEVVIQGPTHFGKNVFQTCSNLTTITIPQVTDTETSNNYSTLFSRCDNVETLILTQVEGETTINIPTSLQSVIKTLQVPETYTIIEDSIFEGFSNLTNFAFDNIVSIGSLAFNGCSSLKSVTFGPKLTSVQADSFKGCSGVRSLKINYAAKSDIVDFSEFTSLQTIEFIEESGYETFQMTITESKDCYATNVVLPKTITKLPTSAFAYYSKLSSFEFPSKVTEIPYKCFSKCKSLNALIIPSTVKSIGSYAFEETGIAIFSIPKSIETLKEQCFASMKSLMILDLSAITLTSLPRGCVSECNQISQIIVSESVVEIGQECFSSSTIKTLNIKGYLQTIGPLAFQNTKVNHLQLSMADDYLLDDNSFLNAEISQLTLKTSGSVHQFSFPAEKCHTLTIDGASDVEQSFFDGFTSLQELSLISVASVPLNALANLNVVTLNLEGEGEYSLQLGGKTVTSINLTGFSSIGENAFANFESLTSFDITPSIKSIGNQAFYKCSNITSIIIPSTIESIGSKAFAECSNLINVTLPAASYSQTSKTLKKAHANERTFIDPTAFDSCDKINELIFEGNDIVSLQVSNVFSQHSELNKVTISEGATGIGSSVFAGMSSLSEVSIPSTVETIQPAAFKGCTNVEPIVSPENKKISYQNGAFLSADKKTLLIVLPKSETFNIPETVETVSEGAFKGNNVVKTIEIPQSVKHIESQAFNDCSQLETIDFKGTNPIESANDVLDKDVTIKVPEGYTGDSLFGEQVTKPAGNNEGGSDGGMIAGIIIAILVVIAIAVGAFIIYRKRKSEEVPDNEVEDKSDSSNDKHDHQEV